MLVRLAAAVVFLMLAAAPAAAGDGPMPAVQQLGSGVLAPDGTTRFVAVPSALSTVLQQVEVQGGAVMRAVDLPGAWGVPTIAYGVAGEGLSANGRTLVLGDVAREYPRRTSGFLVLSAKSMRVLRTISLRGDFAYDAVSPDAHWLYLIQHVDPTNSERYVVRRYDVDHGRLVPGRIADRTQKSWVMAGYPQARATSADGRWVYTLYANPGGYPFVHALDTTRGVAHCVGLPWTGDQSGFYNMRVSLRNGGRTLAAHWLSGRPWLTIDTRSWRISPDRRAGFPWLAIGAAAAAVVAGVGAFLLRRRRRRDEELEEELGKLLREPAPELVG
jgi:hypothetical protein